MQAYNYAAYARVFALGVSKPNMTKIAKALFEPVISADGVFNRFGDPYTINSKNSKAWYDQTDDIPENIKIAAGRQDIADHIGDYFISKILGIVTNANKEPEMYSRMIALIRDSDLHPDVQKELLDYYQDDTREEFLGRAFLYALVGDNTKKPTEIEDEPVESDIKAFTELIKKSHKKPKRMQPPDEVEEHELGYVSELYRVYGELTGEEYVRPEDLDCHPKYRRNFDRQRKDYYAAETIHHELRDTIRLDETEGFDLLKDEVYDGVITTRDRDYDTGFSRMTAVMEHATEIPLSHNLQDRTLDWVGPGEKKGVCHMLVNDDRLRWMEDDDD